MDDEMKLLRCRYLATMVVCFSFGLLFGLVVHLPAVSFMDESESRDVSLVAMETDTRWREGSRLNGRPVGVPKRNLHAELSVTIGGEPKKQTEPSKPAFDNLNDIIDGVFWSQTLENQVPKGFSDTDLDNWRTFASGTKVVDMAEGCGRMQNRIVTFEDGSQSCARYRINTDQIQGEVYSFYLARLLGIKNIPPLVMVTPDQRHAQWKGVSNKVAEAQWSEDKPVVLAKFVKNLVPAYIPTDFRPDTRKLDSSEALLKKSQNELLELVQWSDLVVLDYLTGNLDRVVNNMFNKQWNSEIMDGPAHNLEKSEDLLVFLDNESGLFHGYRLLDKYQSYHDNLLRALCIFRRETVDKLKKYYQNDQIGNDIHRSVKTYEEHHHLLPSIPEKNLKVLKERIGHVLKQVQVCESSR